MNKKFRALLMLVLATTALTACGGDEATTADAEIKTEVTGEKASEPEVTATNEVEAVEKEPEAPPRDLGGLEVIIAQWADVVEPEIKASSQEEATWEFRHEMMDKHNFTLSQKALGLYDTLLELLSTSSMAGEPAAHMFRIHANFALAARDSGLLYDLATLDSLDLSDPKWSQTLIKQMTVGDSVYGVSMFGRPSKVIFFNKRLFEEAGMDPDYLYDLQASGEWTWDKFIEVSAKLTRDTDNDGVNDIYAINMSHGTFGNAAIFSNNGSYMDIDENGQYYYDLPSPESMEAIEWCSDYWQTDYDLAPEHWNGHRELFYSGTIGMYLGI
ncbi:MAG: hypothetical protein ATN31_02040 [Candidatus Epulonipiscioides saccharophilum]|nr:MAG: hypothetical protein ATN31_02040 [Epulopiscium sp. AS2M-Bin001]